eukprot:5079444-Prymnesium_polylepis.1
MRISTAFLTSGSCTGLIACPTSRENVSTSPVPLWKVLVSSWQAWKPSFLGHRVTPGKTWTTGCSCRRLGGMPRQQVVPPVLELPADAQPHEPPLQPLQSQRELAP